jgi:hypothetical protein
MKIHSIIPRGSAVIEGRFAHTNRKDEERRIIVVFTSTVILGQGSDRPRYSIFC